MISSKKEYAETQYSWRLEYSAKEVNQYGVEESLVNGTCDVYTIVSLARLYHYDTATHQRDDVKAMTTLKPLLSTIEIAFTTAQGSIERSIYAAGYHLASILLTSGKGVPLAVEKARFYCEKAALLGDPAAQTMWAVYLQKSSLIDKAVGYFMLAAAQGWIPAQWYLAEYYLKQSDVQSAVKWLALAALQGYEPAERATERFKTQYGVRISPTVLQTWYQTQSERSDLGPHIHHASGRVKEKAGDFMGAQIDYTWALFGYCHFVTLEYFRAQDRQQPFTIAEEVALVQGVNSLPSLTAILADQGLFKSTHHDPEISSITVPYF